MKIQVDGTNTLNKGAELMLYGVLSEIDKREQNISVVYNPSNRDTAPMVFHSKNIKIEKRWIQAKGRYFEAVLRRLGIKSSFFSSKHPCKNIDVVLDAGGFQFSDQWHYSKERLDIMENYYATLKASGTKLIFLPQALGPFTTESGKRTVEILSKYADVVIAREEVSFGYIVKAGFPKEKLWLFPDFTLKVKGQLPDVNIEFIKNGICFIPNKKMLTHTSSKKETYLNLFKNLIILAKEKGLNPFLLNHEGKGDFEICKVISSIVPFEVPIYSDLDAYQVKGLIGNSYCVVSSRFHGVASALNQIVPCLATSWNHKYGELFKDFGIMGNILEVDDAKLTANIEKFSWLLSDENLITQKEVMKKNKIQIEEKVDKMWKDIWIKLNG